MSVRIGRLQVRRHQYYAMVLFMTKTVVLRVKCVPFSATSDVVRSKYDSLDGRVGALAALRSCGRDVSHVHAVAAELECKLTDYAIHCMTRPHGCRMLHMNALGASLGTSRSARSGQVLIVDTGLF